MQLSQAQLTYQISPIILTGGIAGNISGNMLSLFSLTNTNAFSPNLLSGDQGFELDEAFGIFQPAVGGTLVQQEAAKYPYANLSVAANAIIRKELNVSLIMLTPMKQPGAWDIKLAIMQALKATLDQHNNAGGTYTVLTPAFTYTNMLMAALTDVSVANSPIPQNAWRWDFTRPLVVAADLSTSLSNLMNQITNGVPSTGAATGAPTAIGQNPSVGNTGSGTGGTPATVVSSVPFSQTGEGSGFGSST